jgi:hypothetical protein
MPIRTSVVECWACGGKHSWSRRWAALVECDEADVPRPGTPIPRSRSLVPA